MLSSSIHNHTTAPPSLGRRLRLNEKAGAPVLIDWARLLYVTENEERCSKEKQLAGIPGTFFETKRLPRTRDHAGHAAFCAECRLASMEKQQFPF